MSFSGEVKNEAAAHVSGKTNAQVAALAALTVNIGRLVPETAGTASLYVRYDNRTALTKFFTLLRKATNINFKLKSGVSDVSNRYPQDRYRYAPVLLHSAEAMELARLLDLAGDDGSMEDPHGVVPWSLLSDDHSIRSYLRSMFICCGSMSNPEKEYRLEFICTFEEQADQLAGLLEERNIPMRRAVRRKDYVVYTNNADTIADLLTLMNARNGLLRFEDARIHREVRGSVNRQVNCETANIARTVTAAQQQMEDIQLLERSGRLAVLPANLREMAQVRLANPDLSLQGLGEQMNPPVGKSGVNHRLRRLREEAEKIRKGSS